MGLRHFCNWLHNWLFAALDGHLCFVSRRSWGTACVLGRFLICGDKDKHASPGEASDHRFQSLPVAVLSLILFIQKGVRLVSENEEGSMTVFQINESMRAVCD